MNSRFVVLITLLLLARATCFAAAFLDITGLTPGVGTGASFTGTLDGVAVTGTLTAGGNTSFNPVGPGIGPSTIINDSPQWSHGTVYTPTSALDDRVGFSQSLAAGGPALVSLVFASAMTDLIFHIANLDSSILDFSPSAPFGLTGMTLLSGNGGAGDGLTLGGPVISDLAPGTADGTPPGIPPPLVGPRSAYGSVLLSGTYTKLDFVISQTGLAIENANFTVSTPEPGRITLVAMGAASLLLRRRRRIE